MDRSYVDWVRIENVRCVRRADIHVTPLHALIGPNDSGKSTILRAIADAAATFWSDGLGVVRRPSHGPLRAKYPDLQPPSPYDGVSDVLGQQAYTATHPRYLLRFDPDDLRRPQPLIPRGQPIWFESERGLGLASLYDALLSRDRASFAAIESQFRALFPSVLSLRLENSDQHHKTLALTLISGAEVGPQEMSEGMLYWLAFAIIKHLAAPGILLIEEPENGLHPARIAEVMRVLREVSKTTQVIVATHSPLVVNELRPEEVTIVTRTPERGTICTPLTETKNFVERSKVYALGELWLAYADGDLERELVLPPGPDTKGG